MTKRTARIVKPAVQPSHGRRTGAALPVALAVVFVLKLAVLLQLADHPLLQPNASGGLDTQYYLQLADRIRGGDLLLGPGLYAVSPLYIYFLAALQWVGGGSLFVVKLAQILLGTAGCALVWLTARRWFSERAAWIALGLAALTGAFTFYEVVILQAALDPFLTALELWLLARALHGGSGRWAAWAGLAFGLHVLNRPNMILVAVGLLVLLAARAGRRTQAVALGLGLAAALLPLSARNLVSAGTLIPTPSHGGLNLYIGNNPAADGTYRSVQGITPNIAGQADDARRVAERTEGRSLTDQEVSAHFTRRALSWWRSDPLAASRLFLRKVAYTLNRAWLTLNYSLPFYRDEAAVLRWLLIGPLLLIPLGFAGLLAHRAAGRVTPPGFALWAAFVPLSVVSVALFFVASRYRVPLLVALCITGAGTVDAAWSLVRARRTASGGLLLACFVPFFAIAAFNFNLDDGRREEETQMALALIDRGAWEEAEKHIARAAQGHPDPGRLHERIGQALVPANRPAAVIHHLEAAHRLGRRSVRSTFDLAVAYGQAGKTDDAARMLRGLSVDDLRRDPSMANAVADAWTQIGLEMTARGRADEAIEAFGRAAGLTPAVPAAHLNLAVAYAEAGRLGEAREEALRALQLDPGYQRAKEFLAVLARR